MKHFLFAIAGAGLLSTSALAAGNSYDLAGFKDVAKAFTQADGNGDGMVSREEYRMLRMHSTDRSHAGAYRSTTRAAAAPMIDRSFARLDTNSNGSVSASEFHALATQAHNSAETRAKSNNTAQQNEYQSWQPDYVTVSYYMARNPIDTDELVGQEITNLKGDEVGKIARIIRAKETGAMYAMIEIDNQSMYRLGESMQRSEAGVPLDDVLWNTENEALLLSVNGEDWLRDAEARKIENFDVVDKLYRGR